MCGCGEREILRIVITITIFSQSIPFTGESSFGTRKYYYHAFETRMEDAFDTNQVAWITDMVAFPPPVAPVAALAREASRRPRHGDA
jgi:hypothetical protein